MNSSLIYMLSTKITWLSSGISHWKTNFTRSITSISTHIQKLRPTSKLFSFSFSFSLCIQIPHDARFLSLSRLLLKWLSPGQGWLRTLWVGRAQCSSGCDLHFHPLSLSNPGGRAALIYLQAIKRPASRSNTLGRAARLHKEGGSQKHMLCHRCEYTDCLLKSRIDMKIKRGTETAYL